MKGILLKFKVDGTVEHTEINGEPTLDVLKEGIGGGLIEVVPFFNDIRINEEIVKCVAFCDEEGKLRHLELNTIATAAWASTLNRQGRSLFLKDGTPSDYLVGDIAVVHGDEEFMELL